MSYSSISQHMKAAEAAVASGGWGQVGANFRRYKSKGRQGALGTRAVIIISNSSGADCRILGLTRAKFSSDSVRRVRAPALWTPSSKLRRARMGNLLISLFIERMEGAN